MLSFSNNGLQLKKFCDNLNASSIIAASILQNEGYTTHNISDGFSGNGRDLGWKNSGLPIC